MPFYWPFLTLKVLQSNKMSNRELFSEEMILFTFFSSYNTTRFVLFVAFNFYTSSPFLCCFVLCNNYSLWVVSGNYLYNAAKFDRLFSSGITMQWDHISRYFNNPIYKHSMILLSFQLRILFSNCLDISFYSASHTKNIPRVPWKMSR